MTAPLADVLVVTCQPEWTKAEFAEAIMQAGGGSPGAVIDISYTHQPECPRPTGKTCICVPVVQATIQIVRRDDASLN